MALFIHVLDDDNNNNVMHRAGRGGTVALCPGSLLTGSTPFYSMKTVQLTGFLAYSPLN